MSQDDFEQALERQPDNWEHRLVYADWLEERGLDRLAGAQRWMAAKRKCAQPLSGGVIWDAAM